MPICRSVVSGRRRALATRESGSADLLLLRTATRARPRVDPNEPSHGEMPTGATGLAEEVRAPSVRYRTQRLRAARGTRTNRTPSGRGYRDPGHVGHLRFPLLVVRRHDRHAAAGSWTKRRSYGARWSATIRSAENDCSTDARHARRSRRSTSWIRRTMSASSAVVHNKTSCPAAAYPRARRSTTAPIPPWRSVGTGPHGGSTSMMRTL